MKKILFATLASMFFFSTTFAQEVVEEESIVVEEVPVTETTPNSTEDESDTPKKFNHWSLAIGGGMTLMDGDQSQDRHELFPYSSILGGGAISLEYDFNPRVGLFAEYAFLPTKMITTYYPDPFSEAGNQSISTKTYAQNMSLNVSVNLATLLGKCYSNPKWAVYLNVGMGVALYNVDVYNESTQSHDYGLSYRGGYSAFMPIGLSLEYTPVRWLGIFWNNQYNYYFEDDIDSSVKGNADDGILYSGLGLRFKFTKKGNSHMRNISWCQYADQKDELAKEIEKLKKRADNTDKEIAAIKDEIEKLKNKKPEAPAPSLTEADVERMIANQAPADCGVPSVYFNINSYKFSEQAQLTIAEVAQKMYTDKNLMLEVKGYCDYTGTESYNEKLSKERAEAVKKELVNTYGIDANRITTKGMGRTMGPKESYLPNRRCDFIFTTK